MSMHGLSEREISENVGDSSFLERVLASDASTLGSSDDVDLSGYLDRALVGGFPEPALRLQGRARESWLDSYVGQIITRDAPLAGGDRDPDRLRRFLEVVVLNTAGVVADNTLYEAATITARTASTYEQLMRNIFVLDTVPAWANTRLPRLAKVPKRYVVDPSIVTALLRVDRAGLLRDGDLMGRVIETFVAAQIRAELTVSARRARWFHLRDKGRRHEIDLVIEFGAGAVVGIEIKPGSTVRTDDARHLAWLRDNLRDRFIAGLVLHTGPRAFTLSDRIFAAPISTIWAG